MASLRTPSMHWSA